DMTERIAILQKMIGDEQGITENFLCLLIEKRRFGRIFELRDSFNMLYHEHFHIAEVFVTTAVPLEDSRRQNLILKLSQKLQKHILLKESVDSSLIGGMIVQYGDTRMDNSVKTRMQEFQKNIN
ncbi:MAG: ATP synthase F1 subunit delta, partial [Oscillospiraceae bacterium]|nr:ATP synthase F1 subunit delta [Oscillospiraceae bacterium]